MRQECVDGNEAAAAVAYALSELVALYPITPSSPMGEHADAWAASGRTNLWGMVPRVVEMQSEGGAAGALHGALQTGALATTFTSSQGLLLMLPNMFKIAGELSSAVIHVAARAVATHALSIFGDHSDVMAARTTGFAMLASSSVQEAQDLAVVAHLATLQTRVPFLHFFDGFRTSHEMNRVVMLEQDDLRALIDDAGVLEHRERALTPQHPVLRGSAQNPDVFFQSREAVNPFYDAVPAAVQDAMDRLARLTGRAHRLVEYEGHPEADRVIVIMGSGTGAVQETVEELNRRGERVGVITIRLYRPFPAAELLAALPVTVTRVAVLDRTKEPGAYGEPLFLDVVATLAEAVTSGSRDPRAMPRVTGGRYGLSSKEFTPPMVKGVFDELRSKLPRPRFTVGIVDDVTHLSVPPDRDFELPTPEGDVRAVFYGLGSDGTVGANKNTVKIVSEHSDLHAQGYFVYDSKKAGAITVSHLRFSRQEIRSTYLIDRADLVACHQFGLLFTQDVLGVARPGATVLLNAPYAADEVWDKLPEKVQRAIIEKNLKVHVIDAHRLAGELGLRGRINTVMQPCFFALSGILPQEQAIDAVRLAAALLVAYCHAYALAGGPGDPVSTLVALGYGGTLSVAVFFVLSGFLIARSAERSALSGYLAARALRILPALALATVFEAFVLGPLFFEGNVPWYLRNIAPGHLWNMLVFGEDPYLAGVFAHNPVPFVNGALWSLPIEALLYLLLPFLLIVASGRRWVVLALWAACVAAERAAVSYGLADDAPGALLFNQVRVYPALQMASYYLAGVVLWLFRDRVPFDRGMAWSCALLLFAVRGGIAAPRLKSRIGDWSYGIYVFHFPVLGAVVALGGQALPGQAVFLYGIPVVLGLAAFSWHVVEAPALRVRQRLRRTARMGVTTQA